ncbi:MAG: ABC transporter ATP-binding protein [Planctomycetes bacterium]|nr:ABC transporter ATP-binding protein [Planctomycetota bacterium]
MAIILITFAVVMIASGAKALQAMLIKPVIDRFAHSNASERDNGPSFLERIILTAVPTSAPAPPPPADEEPEWARMRPAAGTLAGLSLTFLRNIAILALALSVLMFLFGVLKDTFTNYVCKRIVTDIRNELVEHMTYLPLRHYHNRKAGDLVSRVSNDIQAMEPAANFFFDDVLVQPATILCAGGVIFSANWKLALAAIFFFPLYIYPLVKLGKLMRRARKQSLESLGDMTQAMVETLGGIKVVKAFNMETAQVTEFKRHNEAFLQRMMRAIRQRALGDNISQLFLGLATAVMLAGGGYLLAGNYMTAGEIGSFAIGIAIIKSAVVELSKSYNRLLEASAGCDRIFEILEISREPAHEHGEDLDGIAAGVEFRRVTFSYDTEPVLRDIDLAIRPGEVVALVGRSGAGKTTLCDLLCRFYDPTSGEILIGGKDVRRLRRSNLLRHIAVVAQDTFLFNATIGENVRYGRPDADAESVQAAARAANIHDFIVALEKGYDTVVGERGAKLSGGQRQRVAIARAVLKDPDILILDEATSSLDTENEKLVQQALAELIRGGHKKRITIVIAHRLSTVRDADRIVVLDGGRIVEVGRHDELLERSGMYASLYRTQFAT